MAREQHHGTTILAVRRNGRAVIAGDGQLSLDETIIKHTGRKVRKLFDGRVLAGYAGGAADALALLELFENKLKQYNGELTRSVIEMAKEWRMDRNLRRLEADMIVMDAEKTFVVTGMGEVIEPDDGVCALGSGGPYALSAARALLEHTNLPANEIAECGLKIASQICVFTNSNISMEEIEAAE